jgi:hypothetical protein
MQLDAANCPVASSGYIRLPLSYCRSAALPSSTTFAHSIEHHLKKNCPEPLDTQVLNCPQAGTSASSPLLTLLSVSVPSALFPRFVPLLARRPTPYSGRSCCPRELGRRESNPIHFPSATTQKRRLDVAAASAAIWCGQQAIQARHQLELVP